MTKKAYFFWNVEEYNELAQKMYNAQFGQLIEDTARQLSKCIINGGTIYITGNGGSAADASHFAGELVGRFYKERKGLPCIALNNDTVSITAIGNDYGFGAIFERQLEALFNPEKDIFIGISTSGNSENIIRALDYIGEINGNSIVLLGKDGGEIVNINPNKIKNETHIIVPSNNTPRIQEVHMFILHYWAEFIEEEFVNESNISRS